MQIKIFYYTIMIGYRSLAACLSFCRSNNRDMQRNVPLRKLISAILLVTAGFLGNFFAPQLFPGFNYLFGSIAVFIAVRLFGMGWGVVTAIASSLHTIVLFGHPYPVIWLTLEPVFISLAIRHTKTKNLVIYDAIYWPLIGCPLIWFVFHYIMKASVIGTIPAMLMYWIIGITNALIAGIIMNSLPITRWTGIRVIKPKVSMHRLIFYLVMSIFLIPAILIMIAYGRMNVRENVATIRENLSQAANHLALHQKEDGIRVDGQSIHKLVQEAAQLHQHHMTIVDQTGKIIATSQQNIPLSSRYSPLSAGEVSTLASDFYRVLPIADKTIPMWQRAGQANFVLEHPLADGYRLIAEAPFAEYQRALLIKHRNGLFVLLALTLLTLTVALFFSRRFSRDLVKLSVLTTDLPLQIVNGQEISWPESQISEIYTLIDNFREIAEEMKEKFGQLARSNELLEARISERTRDMYREIAERKAKEIDLRNSEERYRHMFEDNHAIMLIIDPTDGTIVDANPAACSFYGYERTAFRTMKMSSIVTIPPEAMIAGMKMAIENQQHTTILDHCLATGEIRPVEIYCGPVDFQGKTLLYAIVHDITERKVAEEKVRKMTEELEERVATRTAALEHAISELEAFSYSVSHDLRGPVRNLNGLSHLLLEDYADKLDEIGESYLQRIVTASSKMGHLIDDLLNLSRVSRHKLQVSTVNLSKMAREIADELSATAPDRVAEFIIADGLATRGDAHLLSIALDNLLGNSWKYSARKEVAVIEFGTTAYEGESVYFVRDNGAGFDMEYSGNLFNAFQRLHKADEFEGTGIGLATVQRIILRHHGKIWGEGRPGEGAVFYFTLP